MSKIKFIDYQNHNTKEGEIAEIYDAWGYGLVCYRIEGCDGKEYYRTEKEIVKDETTTTN